MDAGEGCCCLWLLPMVIDHCPLPCHLIIRLSAIVAVIVNWRISCPWRSSMSWHKTIFTASGVPGIPVLCFLLENAASNKINKMSSSSSKLAESHLKELLLGEHEISLLEKSPRCAEPSLKCPFPFFFHSRIPRWTKFSLRNIHKESISDHKVIVHHQDLWHHNHVHQGWPGGWRPWRQNISVPAPLALYRVSSDPEHQWWFTTLTCACFYLSPTSSSLASSSPSPPYFYLELLIAPSSSFGDWISCLVMAASLAKPGSTDRLLPW